MRVYLSVPYAEKEEAKKYGARWDPNKKLWYSPDGRKELVDKWSLKQEEAIVELIGEDRNFGGNILFVDLIPQSCWFTNVRKCVDFLDWDRLRKFVYERSNYQCECCQTKAPLDAHERWHFDEDKKVQKLMRIIALCKPCHEVTHIGLAQIKGRGEIATQHLMQVTGMSQLNVQIHIKEAFDLWMKRNKFQWELNLSIITNSGIKLAQEFNAMERQALSKNETSYIRELGNNDITNRDFLSTNSIIEKTKTFPDSLNNNRIEISSLKSDSLKNSIRPTEKIKILYQRIIKAFFPN